MARLPRSLSEAAAVAIPLKNLFVILMNGWNLL
jgi:flagellar biosynthesis protein FliP